MRSDVVESGRRRCGYRPLLVFSLAVAVSAPASLHAITPDTPRVRSAVKKAVEYLEGTNDGRLGAKSLVGLTLAKHGADPSHPKIAEAVKSLQAALKNGPDKFTADIYSTGVSIMFLVAVDASRYRYEIEALVKSLHLRQKSHGAWGYPLSHEKHGQTCDTSMTQYAVLGLWEAEDQAGVETPRLVWDRAARWLLLTQDPDGGFGYQGTPAARLGRRIDQAGVKHSMTVAALGSLYIAKDRVGITKLKKAADDDTPEAFEPFESREQRAARTKTRIDSVHFSRAVGSGNRWVEKNYDVDSIKDWIYYSLYALERYESLREAEAAGRNQPMEKTDKSKWYNRGAKYLLRTQNDDGSWESQAGAVPDTCFGALFLMGSTRKTLAASSIARYGAGTLIGGRGVPGAEQIRLRNGQLVPEPLDAPPAKVLDQLHDPTTANYARAVESLAAMSTSGTGQQLDELAPALSRLSLRGAPSVRVLSIQCLAKTRRLSHVPLLIYLLDDADAEVVEAADRALCQLSRKYSSGQLGGDSSQKDREAAIETWRTWYRSIRPDVDLDAFDPSTFSP